MPGLKAGYRKRLFSAVHAEAAKRKIDHDALHDMCAERFKVRSMADMTDRQLAFLYHDWTGKGLRRRAALPRKGEAAAAGAEAQIVSGEELIELGREFAKREIGEAGRGDFIARQLRGRREIRTRRDWVKVIGGLRAMNRRAGEIDRTRKVSL